MLGWVCWMVGWQMLWTIRAFMGQNEPHIIDGEDLLQLFYRIELSMWSNQLFFAANMSNFWDRDLENPVSERLD